MVSRTALAAALLLSLPGVAEAQGCRDRLVPRSPAVASASRAIVATDLIELRDFGFPDSGTIRGEMFSLSPDGRTAALQLWRADAAANRYCTGIVLVDLASGGAHLLDVGGEPILMRYDVHGLADRIVGEPHAPSPAWSPDGTTLLYLRREQGVTQLWRVVVRGGPAAPLTSGTEDIRGFAWEAGGATIRIETRPSVTAERAQIAVEGRSGYRYDRRFWALSDAAPSPSAANPMRWERIDARTGARLGSVEVSPEGDDVSLEVKSPSGERAWTAALDARVFLGPEPLSVARRGHVTRCPDASCAERVRGLWWQPDGSLLFLRDWANPGAGRLELFRWRAGHKPVSLYASNEMLMDCQYRQFILTCAHETALRPRHLWTIDTRTLRQRVVYDPNPEFAAVQLGSVERLAVRAADGAPAYADLVLPPDHVAGQKHPMIVVQYSSQGFLRGGTGDEYPIHLLAARGYAVLSYNRPTPASAGKVIRDPSDVARHSVADWADRRRTFSALEAAVDAAIARGAVDADKLGITGLSEGAASAVWAMLNTQRYRAAALGGCCEDPSTTRFAVGPQYLRETMAWGYPGPGKDDPDFWRPYSIGLGADRIATPLLLQLADSEYRLALEAAATLEQAGKPIDFYVFPNEYHIKWQPAHRLAIYSRAIDWFDFWLRDRVDPAPAKSAQFTRWRALRKGTAP